MSAFKKGKKEKRLWQKQIIKCRAKIQRKGRRECRRTKD